MSQSSSVASSSDGPAAAGQRARAPVDAQLHPRGLQRRQRARQEQRRRAAVHEQRLGRVADARLLDLGVEDDRLGGVEVGRGVDEDVAVARRGVDHRHGRDGLQRGLQPLAAAREDQVDDAVLRRQLGELRAPAAGDEPDRALGHARRHRGLGGDRRQHGVGVRRRRRPAQHDRVAGLQAQRGGVDRDVRPRLVDDRDDAERHAQHAHVQAVGQPLALDDLADRVGQRGDRARARRDAGDPRRVERQAVEQRVADAGGAAGLHVARVRLDDLVGAGDQRVGDRLQRGVLRVGVQRRQRACGGARRQADVGDRAGRSRHGEKGTPGASAQHEVVAVDRLVGRARHDLAHGGGLHPLDLAELVGGVVADPLADDDRAVRDLRRRRRRRTSRAPR